MSTLDKVQKEGASYDSASAEFDENPTTETAARFLIVAVNSKYYGNIGYTYRKAVKLAVEGLSAQLQAARVGQSILHRAFVEIKLLLDAEDYQGCKSLARVTLDAVDRLRAPHAPDTVAAEIKNFEAGISKEALAALQADNERLRGRLREITNPYGISDEERDGALRFWETCEDNEGYDVSRKIMDRLAECGIVVYFGRKKFGTTSALWLMKIASDALSQPEGTEEGE